MHWDFALILLFLGIAVPLLGRRRVRQLMRLPATTKIDRLSLYASTMAFQWVASGLVLWRTSSHGIAATQLGLAFGNPALTSTITVLGCAFILLNQIFSLRRLASRPSEARGVIPQLALKLFPQDDVERLAFFALVATVSLCEEVIYRGFVQCMFQDWLQGSIFFGVLGSALYFALAHLYQGRRGLMATFSAGLVFSGMRAWTGSLIPSIAAHFVADITVGLLAPQKIRSALPGATATGE
jgi:membrane protease YdiL (CAAX protease family)